METATQSSIDLPGIKKLRSGKVREVFDLGENLLFVATLKVNFIEKGSLPEDDYGQRT